MKRIYQFFDFTSGTDIYNKVLKINQSGAVAVFDIEDAFFIPFNELSSSKLKSRARRIISEFIKSSNTEELKLGIRINHYDSGDFKKDLSLMSAIKNQRWDCIFLPKVEDLICIRKYITALKKSGIKFDSLIPIVENRNGMSGFKNLCLGLHEYKISKVAFGHCDFNLDSGIFPFVHLNDFKLLTIIKEFIKTMNEFSLEYVNTPYLELDNSKDFKKILKNIFSVSGKNFSQVTLCKNQTNICKTVIFDSGLPVTVIKGTKQSSNEFANRIIKQYNSNAVNGKGFAVNGNKEVISPHEFIAATKILESSNEI
jgi:citrate lyase beta subunit